MTQSHQATLFFASRLALWRGLFERMGEADRAIILPGADKAHWEAGEPPPLARRPN